MAARGERLLGGGRGRLFGQQGPGDAYRSAAGQHGGSQSDQAQPRLQGEKAAAIRNAAARCGEPDSARLVN